MSEGPLEPSPPIHLGHRLARVAIVELLDELQRIGENHGALNLKYGTRPAEDVLEELGDGVVRRVPAQGATPDPVDPPS